jgi:hypothetical protein
MKSFSVNGIPAGYYFSEPLYIDDGFILTAPEMPFTGELKKILNEWRFDKEIATASRRKVILTVRSITSGKTLFC